eukprot:jgi/Tetstr1/434297/TSEL_023404.t1
MPLERTYQPPHHDYRQRSHADAGDEGAGNGSGAGGMARVMAVGMAGGDAGGGAKVRMPSGTAAAQVDGRAPRAATQLASASSEREALTASNNQRLGVHVHAPPRRRVARGRAAGLRRRCW